MFVLCFFLPFFAFVKKKPVVPPERAFLFIFECLPLFLLSLFGLPLFQLLFLCLSLSLSLVLCFLSSFLSFFFAFFWFLVFCLSFVFLSSLLLFHERNNMKRFNCKSYVIIPFSFFGFLSCFLFEIPFSYLCFFLVFSYVFCSTTSMFLVKKKKVEKHQLLVERGDATKVFFYNLCFLKSEKLLFFGPFFRQILVDVPYHYRNRYFSTFSKAKQAKKWPFLKVSLGAK